VPRAAQNTWRPVYHGMARLSAGGCSIAARLGSGAQAPSAGNPCNQLAFSLAAARQALAWHVKQGGVSSWTWHVA